MEIATLADRFEHYATIDADIAHDPESKTPSFLVCDIEEIQVALKTGIKFPIIFLQVPEFTKEGLVDNAIESVEASYMILMPGKAGYDRSRLQLFDTCRAISNRIINYMVEDSPEYFQGGQIKTAEGRVGPLADWVYGWGVNFGFDQAYNAQVDESKRRIL